MQSLLCALVFAFAPLFQSTTAAREQPARGATAEVDLAPFDALATDLQVAFGTGDPREFRACFDLDPLFEKATAGVEVDADFRKGFCTGLASTLLPGLMGSVRHPLENGGALRLLRIRTRDGEQRLLFRLLQPNDGGVDYVEFVARVGRDGKARARDWYVYSSGEWVSESIHRLYLPFALESRRDLLDRMLGKDQVMVKHWGELKEMIACVREERSAAGLKIFAGLPEEMRRDKFVLLQRLHLTQISPDETEYAKALEDLRRFHPNDPANELHSVDYFYMRKEWTQAADAVRRLRQGIEGDPFLDYLESSLLFQADDLVGARKSVERAVAAEPEFLQAHWVLVSIALKQKDHPAVLAALKVIDELFELEWNDLSTAEEYKDFAASREFGEWKKYLAAK